MKNTPTAHKKNPPERVVTIHEPQYTIVISLHRSKTSARGNLEYRSVLKDIIQNLEGQLGRYRRRK